IAERAKEVTDTWEEGDHFGALAILALLYGDIKCVIELGPEIMEKAQKARRTFALGEIAGGGTKVYPVTVGGTPRR
ncbi:MAG: hypothetical protein KDA60_15445, partial [Planctomycetales bacterium]|nr:hypothetical protein [Planctomycetales bacterium]